MVYLTGDTHGELDRFKEGELRRAGKGDIVIVPVSYTHLTLPTILRV